MCFEEGICILTWKDQLILIISGKYSPDGKTIGCLLCPDGHTTMEEGARSLAECSGITQKIPIYLVNMHVIALLIWKLETLSTLYK